MSTNQFKTGDLIRFNNEGSRKYGYGLVIRLDRHGKDGFYYIKCDKYGRIEFCLNSEHSAANYIKHSHMLLSCVVKVIRNFKLNNSFGLPSSGIIPIDNYLSLLDGRYGLFRSYAPTEMIVLFDKNEDLNYHSENGILVAQWYEQFLLKNPSKEGMKE